MAYSNKNRYRFAINILECEFRIDSGDFEKSSEQWAGVVVVIGLILHQLDGKYWNSIFNILKIRQFMIESLAIGNWNLGNRQ